MSTWDAFDELCANSDGFPSGCYCIGFHEEGPVPKAAGINRERDVTQRIEVVDVGVTAPAPQLPAEYRNQLAKGIRANPAPEALRHVAEFDTTDGVSQSSLAATGFQAWMPVTR